MVMVGVYDESWSGICSINITDVMSEWLQVRGIPVAFDYQSLVKISVTLHVLSNCACVSKLV